VDAQFHFERFIADERRQSVMIGEVDQIHTRLAAAGDPGAGGLVAVVPATAVAQLVMRGEALDIFHERA
jgi:hypothetical protein